MVRTLDYFVSEESSSACWLFLHRSLVKIITAKKKLDREDSVRSFFALFLCGMNSLVRVMRREILFGATGFPRGISADTFGLCFTEVSPYLFQIVELSRYTDNFRISSISLHGLFVAIILWKYLTLLLSLIPETSFAEVSPYIFQIIEWGRTKKCGISSISLLLLL